MKTAVFIFLSLLMSISAGNCFIIQPKPTIPQKQMTVFFHHTIGNDTLVLGKPCKNIFGENIIIQKFKYYVSNFAVTDNLGKTTVLPVQYFLIDESDAASKIITLPVPDMAISSIRFLLGVDSIKNVSGIQTGALDPLQGMFWTWNSGYIMAKLEGSSENSPAAGHYFQYHIGGFQKATNATRVISLSVKDISSGEIHITADINQWFKSKTEIRTAETPVCHSPGALAMQIADNYSTMFSINDNR